MKKIINKIISLWFIILIPGQVFANSNEISTASKIQDTEKAAKYFEDELDFTTGPYGVKNAIVNKKDIVIVDVRAANDYAQGHIPGAINLPNFDAPEAELKGLRKDTINYVYCYTLLCNASQKACKKFASLGYPVKEIRGGFKSWAEHNYPIEKN